MTKKQFLNRVEKVYEMGLLKRKYGDPKPGWHFNYCISCGERCSKISHFGGSCEFK